MVEENKTPQVEEQEIDPETKKEIEQLQKAIDRGRMAVINGTYKSINYENLFTLFGQPEKYETFKQKQEEHKMEVDKLIEEYKDSTVKPEFPKAPLWSDFLDDKDQPLTVGMMADIWNVLVSMMIKIGLDSGEAMTGSIYDALIGQQLLSVQGDLETFSAAIGNIQRRLDDAHIPNVKKPE